MGRLRVLVTAATRPLGRALCHQLYNDVENVEHVIATASREDLPYYFRDYHHDRFTYRGADLLKKRHLKGLFLSERFRERGIDQVVHFGFLRSIKARGHDPGEAVQATARLLERSIDAGVSHFVYISGSLVYRLRPWTSAVLDEESELDYDPDTDPWTRTRVDTDTVCRTKMDTPGVTITVLRPGPLMGRNVTSHLNDLLDGHLVVRLAGFDPMTHPIHSTDMRRCVRLVLEKEPRGVFNVAGPDVAPLSEFCRLNGRPTFTLPGPLLRPANRLQRLLRLSTIDLSTLPRWLMYPCVLDTSKIERAIGFKATHHIKFGDG